MFDLLGDHVVFFDPCRLANEHLPQDENEKHLASFLELTGKTIEQLDINQERQRCLMVLSPTGLTVSAHIFPPNFYAVLGRRVLLEEGHQEIDVTGVPVKGIETFFGDNQGKNVTPDELLNEPRRVVNYHHLHPVVLKNWARIDVRSEWVYGRPNLLVDPFAGLYYKPGFLKARLAATNVIARLVLKQDAEHNWDVVAEHELPAIKNPRVPDPKVFYTMTQLREHQIKGKTIRGLTGSQGLFGPYLKLYKDIFEANPNPFLESSFLKELESHMRRGGYPENFIRPWSDVQLKHKSELAQAQQTLSWSALDQRRITWDQEKRRKDNWE